VLGGPVVQRGAEPEHEVGAGEQAGGGRGGEAAADAEVVGVAGEQPVGHRGGGQHRPDLVGQRDQPLAGVAADRATAGEDGRPPRPLDQVGGLGDRRRRGRRGARRRPGVRRLRLRELGRLHVEREQQHHRSPVVAGAPPGARHVLEGAARGVDPLHRGPDGGARRRLVDPEVGVDRRRRRVGGQQQQRRA
jgi:hypothetical protein